MPKINNRQKRKAASSQPEISSGFSPGGRDSQIAAATFMACGYRNVSSLLGGTRCWHELGYPLQTGSGIALDQKLLMPPIVKISLLSRLAVTTAAFVVKPA